MPNVIPLPITNIDMQLSEVRAVLDLLISVGENAEPAEWLRLRGATVSTLYSIGDKLASADRSLPMLARRS